MTGLARRVARATILPLAEWVRFRLFERREPVDFLVEIGADEVRWNDHEARPSRKWAKLRRFGGLRGRDVLVIGCGDGEEVRFWRGKGPRRLVGTDIGEPEPAWRSLAGGGVCFLRADAMALPFRDGAFDVVLSDAVLEHVRDLGAVMRESRRVLRPGGLLYASAGPLYRTWGGPHCVGSFHHLLLDPEAFEVEVRRAPPPDRRFWEAGLINRLRFADHVETWKGFERLYLGVLLCDRGLRFRRERPVEWARLRAAHAELDLLLKTFIVVLRRTGA